MDGSFIEFAARLKANVELLQLLEVRDRVVTRGQGWRKLNSSISIRCELLNEIKEIEA